jgi:hypothetical protein
MSPFEAKIRSWPTVEEITDELDRYRKVHPHLEARAVLVFETVLEI